MATFKERFNDLFDKSNLSQEEFGKMFGASKSQVFNWRSGRGEPDSETMKLISKTCNVSVAWLLGCDIEETIGINDILIHAERMNLTDEQKELLKIFKNLTISEKENKVYKVIDKIKNLSDDNQEAIIKLINSIQSHS